MIRRACRLQPVNESSNLNHHFIPSSALYVTYRNTCISPLMFWSNTVKTGQTCFDTFHDFPYGLLGTSAVPSNPIHRLVEDVGAVSCWLRPSKQPTGLVFCFKNMGFKPGR